jgi:hypothetical protein
MVWRDGVQRDRICPFKVVGVKVAHAVRSRRWQCSSQDGLFKYGRERNVQTDDESDPDSYGTR